MIKKALIQQWANEAGAYSEVIALGRHDGVLFTLLELEAFAALAAAHGAAQRDAELLGVVELPGADWECFSESGCSYYGLAYYEKTVRELIAAARLQGERVNQGLLEALKGILAGATSWQLREHDQCVLDARAAIAAAEKGQP